MALPHNRNPLLWALVVSALLILCALVAMVRNAFALHDAYGWVRHTLVVEESVREFAGTLAFAQSQSRGYVISQQPSWLAVHRELADATSGQLAAIRQLVADNSAQTRRVTLLQAALDRQIAWWRRIETISKQEGFDAAAREIASGVGENNMTTMRTLVNEMIAEEDQYLSEREAQSAVAERWSGWGQVAVGLLLLLQLAAVIGLIVNRFRVLAREQIIAQGARDYSESIVATVRTPLLVLDSDLRVRTANRAFLLHFGLAAAEVEGRALEAIGAGGWNNPHLRERLGKILPQETELLDFAWEHDFGGTLGRRSLLLNARKVYRPGNHTGLMLLALEDITERKAAVDALERKEAELRLAVAAVNLGAWRLEVDTGKLESSDRLRELFDVKDALDRDGFVARIHPDDRAHVLQQLGDAIKDRTDYISEYRVVWADGSVHWLQSFGRATYGSGDTPTILHGVTQDLTDRRAAEQAVRDANTQLEAFSYSVAHDLRAPLRTMSTFSQVLIEDFGAQLPPAAREHLGRIQDSAIRMDRLVSDLLDYSRLTRMELKIGPVSLESIVADAQTTLSADLTACGAVVEVAPGLPPVKGSAPVLSQIVTNLIANGAKFVAPGTTPHIRVRAETRNGAVRLWIEDNGIGIAPKHQERIFRVFERLHAQEQYPGTGIGLAIVRKGAERMRGTCGVESIPGAGARFWVELPAANAA